MMTAKGYRCDAEVGRPGRGWRTCLRKAVAGRQAMHAGELHYCNRHINRAVSPKPKDMIPAPNSIVRWLD